MGQCGHVLDEGTEFIVLRGSSLHVHTGKATFVKENGRTLRRNIHLREPVCEFVSEAHIRRHWLNGCGEQEPWLRCLCH